MFKVICLLVAGLLAVALAAPYTYDTEHNWIKGNLSIPLTSNVIVGGFDPYGYRTYIGRVAYGTNILPARVVAETGYAYFNTDKLSNKLVDYQLLTSSPRFDYEWIRSFDGNYENGAVAVGTTHWNERVFICRAKADGGLLMGTLFLSQKNCIIKNEDLPLRQFDKYEILVAKSKTNSTFNA
ncbi:hypothetical protein AWZ03_002389 [Drosophila navojoa]|uniref:Uncharacterized protein n=1 Tax=Drosophila navojoa TaxID=7232 RepID=A0A484BSV2_DRONA|nr:uncharacterized protein LOC108651236 [Drosophila navojoa]TDG51302.1 hypothetical protein AWZ03_002389 [Drosophila navojoa]